MGCIILKISKQELLKLVLESMTDEVNIPFESFSLSDEEKSEIYNKHFSNHLMKGDINTRSIGEVRSKNIFDDLDTLNELNSKDYNDDITQIPGPTSENEDSYFDYYPVRDKKYLEVLKGKITYPEYLKQKDERYYYLLKIIDTINNIVGFKVLPRIDLKTYYKLEHSHIILDYLKNYNKNTKYEYENPLAFKKVIRPTKEHIQFKYDSYLNSISKKSVALTKAYAKFDDTFIPAANEFANLIYILDKFLLPEYLLASIIRPQSLRNPKKASIYPSGKDIEIVVKPFKPVTITTANPVRDYEYNLVNFTRNLLSACVDNVQNPIEEGNFNYLKQISREIDETYMKYKDSQFIELIVPNFSDKLAKYNEYKNLRRVDKKYTEGSVLEGLDQLEGFTGEIEY